MKSLAIIAAIVAFLGYSIVGTSGRVEEIKRRAPGSMESRNWKILRYEGWQYGSWGNHGGKVWYHVANLDDASIQYRVYVTLWGGELHYCYGDPEPVSRLNIRGEVGK